jgi:hypothetical protein
MYFNVIDILHSTGTLTCNEITAGSLNSSLRDCIQNSCGAHPGSCLVGTRGSFSGGKVAGA